jgi:PAT family beta-lactamase induction signal transducer AmpG
VAVNAVCALQDVAIDALAVSSLRQEERGLGNGLMFAGAYIGQALGGSGMLYLASSTGSLDAAFFAVAGMVAVVWGTTFFFMKEAPDADSAMLDDVRVYPVVRAIGSYVWDMLAVILAPPGEALSDDDVVLLDSREGDSASAVLFAAAMSVPKFVGSVARRRIRPRFYFWRQPAMAGALFAFLPASAMALGLALQAALAVEVGLTDGQIANLGLVGAVTAATGSVLGGWISDRTGHRRTLAVYVVLTLLPTAILAWNMQQFGWIEPVPEGADPRVADPGLVQVFWYSTIVYGFFTGLTYGTRMAIFMKVCEPKLAATQFTAYMALSNLAIS